MEDLLIRFQGFAEKLLQEKKAFHQNDIVPELLGSGGRILEFRSEFNEFKSLLLSEIKATLESARFTSLAHYYNTQRSLRNIYDYAITEFICTFFGEGQVKRE